MTLSVMFVAVLARVSGVAVVTGLAGPLFGAGLLLTVVSLWWFAGMSKVRPVTPVVISTAPVLGGVLCRVSVTATTASSGPSRQVSLLCWGRQAPATGSSALLLTGPGRRYAVAGVSGVAVALAPARRDTPAKLHKGAGRELS